MIGSKIRESFVPSSHSLTRMLTVNGNSGLSKVNLTQDQFIEAPSETWQDLWDRSFLANDIAYPTAQKSTRTISIADVFCGVGGLSLGVRDGIRACGIRDKSALAVDIDSKVIDVYRRNFDPTKFSTCNLWTSVTRNYATRNNKATFLGTPKLLNEELMAARGTVDILLGGPPCEGHSTSNNVTRRNDPRNRYYVVMPAIAVALEAKAVIVENVPGVRNDERRVLNTARDLFETSNYHVDEAIVDALSTGVPQTRKRHFLIASRHRKPNLQATIEALRRPHRNLQWAINDIMSISSADLLDQGAELSDVNRLRIKYLFDNDEYDLPNEQRPKSHRDGHTYPSIYGRLRWDAPAGTITTGFNTPGRGRYIHPEVQRTITPHEAARIQGFPDSFEFKLVSGEIPTRTSLAKMIGDAVPPQMGYVAGVAALAALDFNST